MLSTSGELFMIVLTLVKGNIKLPSFFLGLDMISVGSIPSLCQPQNLSSLLLNGVTVFTKWKRNAPHKTLNNNCQRKQQSSAKEMLWTTLVELPPKIVLEGRFLQATKNCPPIGQNYNLGCWTQQVGLATKNLFFNTTI